MAVDTLARESTGPSAAGRSRRATLFAAGVIAIAAWAAYHNSFRVPLFFDDEPAILENPTIRQLWPLSDVLSPPKGGSSVAGRPVVNLSLAINYRFGGLSAWGYHAFNLAVHVLAALPLCGIVRRTLLRPGLRARFGEAARPLAVVAAGWWVLHPLQTESVTCVIQRTELLLGLFFLLTFYGFIRALDSENPRRWQTLSVAACVVGMATKEVMVTAPLLVFLYDRTFAAGSFWAAWRIRRSYYVGLASSWLLLGALVVGMGGTRGPAAGFGVGMAWWTYALKQCEAVVRYFGLAVWPHPLVLDYGTDIVEHVGEVAPQLAVLVVAVAGVIVALVRRPAWGFVGAWGFVILAPSSSVVPLAAQTMAEHRMYLPLVAIVVPAVLGLHRVLGRRGLAVGAALAVALGWTTERRNADYATEVGIWTDTVAKCPNNARAHFNLGSQLPKLNRLPEAIGHYERALRLEPNYPEAHSNYANALKEVGRRDDALAHYREALRQNPEFAEAHNNLGDFFRDQGRLPEALVHYRLAIRFKPVLPEPHLNLGNTLRDAGRPAEALAHYTEALRRKPDFPEAAYGLGAALHDLGRSAEAVEQFARALQARPNYPEAENNLGVALAALGRLPEAVAHYERALRLKPDNPGAHQNLGIALQELGRLDEAIAQFEAALRLRPDYAEAHNNFAVALQKIGRPAEARTHYERAVQLRPDFAEAHFNLGNALRDAGQTPAAIARYERALELNSALPLAHNNLADLLKATGRIADAIAHYEHALRLQPGLLEAHNNLGNALKAAGRLPEAIAHYEQALRLDPDSAGVHYNFALALDLVGRRPEAAAHYRTARRLRPDLPPVPELEAGR